MPTLTAQKMPSLINQQAIVAYLYQQVQANDTLNLLSVLSWQYLICVSGAQDICM